MSEDSSIPQKIVPVLVPMPAERPYSYAVPEGMEVRAGSIVRVPLGPREVAGIVTGGSTDSVDARKLRPISQLFECPPVDEGMMRFMRWAADYTISPPGMVARMVLRVPAAFDPEPPVPGLRFCGREPERMTGARARVLELAEDGMAWTRTGLAHAAGVSASVVDGLVAQGVFEPVMIPPRAVVAAPDADYAKAVLSGDQTEAAAKLDDAVARGGFSVSLLDGVTGSGKTEVYFEAVARAIEQGRQVLILLPEIALTQQFLDRFHDRFGSKPAEWHSDLAPKTRERVWRQVMEGQVRVVAGARSALFLPFP
ncbi:MAG: DEAD/DEAH box helicase, partial [Alphaproteobacteria bacterium]